MALFEIELTDGTVFAERIRMRYTYESLIEGVPTRALNARFGGCAETNRGHHWEPLVW